MPARVRFVETMVGQVARHGPVRLPDWTDDPHGYDLGVRRAAGADHPAGVEPFGLYDLMIEIQPQSGPDDGLPGVVRGGTVRHRGRSYRVTAGRFVALAASPVHGRRLRYRITGESRTGERVDVAGVKWVTGRPWRWWADTSRMFIVVSTMDGGSTVVAGVVRLRMWAFLRQLATVRGRPADVAAFVWRFVARLVRPARRR